MGDHDINQAFNRGCYARSLGLPLEAVDCFETEDDPWDKLEWGKGWTWQNARGEDGPIRFQLIPPTPGENVVLWPGVTRVDTAPEHVLKKVVDADLEHMVVIGYRKDESEFFASTYAGGPDVVWLLNRGIHNLMVIGGGALDE